VGKPVLLILSHAVEEHDQVKLLSSLGYDVFSLGGYIDPSYPHVDTRPALPEVPSHPDLKAAVDALGTDDNIAAAAKSIPDPILEWLGDDGAIICHHYIEERIYPQWDFLRDWKAGAPGRRIIRRTVGQSVAHNEKASQAFRAEGLEIVRYSPNERLIPDYAGEDALIRFWVDLDAYSGWTGRGGFVGNVTQHLWQRGEWTNGAYAAAAIRWLPALFAGPGSDAEGVPVAGVGRLSVDGMRSYLRAARVYLYTGTQPASYTLGLMEAMATGVPVVSIGSAWMRAFAYGPLLFEAEDFAYESTDDPAEAHRWLRILLNDDAVAQEASALMRKQAVEMFDPEAVGAAWQAFLG
jgi:glycosyltransferase involved in cell wall biosynthesis